MHMADALLSPGIGLAMYAAAAGAAAAAVKKNGRGEDAERRAPLMAVMGAFIFAAQMINFTIPGTGSSGHLGGGILLAALLGASPSLIVMTAILAIQCLFFADGGLLALGANIFNMGVIPCMLVYPLVFKPIARGAKRLGAAAVVSAVVSLQLGGLAVTVQTLASGIAELPFSTFLLLMQPIHLAIGVVEGIVTALVLRFVLASRPELISGDSGTPFGIKRVLLTFGTVALLLGGVISPYASSLPDGLEWSVERASGQPEIPANGPVFDAADRIRSWTAFLPDYGFAGGSLSSLGTSVSGMTGSLIAFLTVGAAGWGMSLARRRKRP